MTTIHFGIVDLEVYDNVEVESLFHHDGKFYWYRIVMDHEDESFKIEDTCGRMIPLGIEEADQFGTAIFAVNHIYRAQREAKQMVAKKTAEALAVAQHFMENP